MLEKHLQAKIIKRIRALGGIAFKTIAVGVRGFPDVVAVLPGGIVLFIEVKLPGGRISRFQTRILKKLSELGANAWVIKSMEELEINLSKVLAN